MRIWILTPSVSSGTTQQCAKLLAALVECFPQIEADGHDHCWSCLTCSKAWKKLNQWMVGVEKDLTTLRK